MARPQKQTADYFPHQAQHGKTMYVIEELYGNDGYAFWFKLLELLCQTDGHCYYADSPSAMMYIAAKAHVDEHTAVELLNHLAKLDAIDRELWEHDAGIWCQNLVDNLADLYRKRLGEPPTRPEIKHPKPVKAPVSGGGMDAGGSQTGDGNTEIKSDKKKSNKTEPVKVGPWKVPANWWDEFRSEQLTAGYNENTFNAEIKKFIDYWTDSRRSFKSVKLALRNWFKKAKEFANNRPASARKELPDTQSLQEAWK